MFDNRGDAGRQLAERLEKYAHEDVLVLAIGRPVNDALKAHALLADQGVSAMVVDCRFVKPIDRELICSMAEKIPRIITVEEHVCQGGFGSAVLECLNDEGMTGVTVKRIGLPDIFIEHGPQELLRSKYGIDATAIVHAAEKLMAQFTPPQRLNQRQIII